MIRIALVLALVALLASVGATAAAPSELPPYIKDKGSGFAVYTNKHWRVEGVGPAKELEKRDPGSFGSEDRSFRIWAPTCKPGQKLTFTRSVDLLGRPSFATVSFDSGLPLEFFEIFFGSTKVARDTTTIEKKDLRALHAGPNDIDIVVKLKKAADACRPVGVEAARRGVYLEFEGTFSAGLQTVDGEEDEGPEVYLNAGEHLYTLQIYTGNLGPSIIPEGTFEVSTSGPGFCVDRRPENSCAGYMFRMVAVPVAGGPKCVNEPVYRHVSKCTFRDLAPGRIRSGVTVNALVAFEPDPATPDWVEEDVYLQWGVRIAVGGPSDPDGSDNDGKFRIVFCHYGASGDACKPKPAP